MMAVQKVTQCIFNHRMNDSGPLLKIAINSRFLMITPNLNQSLKVEGKKEFLKLPVLQWNIGAWFTLALSDWLIRIKFFK